MRKLIDSQINPIFLEMNDIFIGLMILLIVYDNYIVHEKKKS